jgi:mono/diheme cytochrome c family protein
MSSLHLTVGLATVVAFAAYGTARSPEADPASPRAAADSMQERIARGRQLVIEHACGDCHGGGSNPASPAWLLGVTDSLQIFQIGPFKTRPRNLTPDNTTGLGRFSERQLFNALRYGLRPGETPDVEITSSTPGQGSFPEAPKYLAIPMPWPAFRHMADEDIWAIAAYLKHGVKPARNLVADSDGPPDFWASEYTVEKIGPWPAARFPSDRERPAQQP